MIAGEYLRDQLHGDGVRAAIVLVDAFEDLLVAAFAAERLHGPDATHRLDELDDDQCDRLASAAVGAGRGVLEPARHPDEERERQQRDERQLDVEHEQDDRDRHDRDEREHDLLDAAVDQLGDGVHVGSHARDHTARRVALVEAHRQPLEVVEHALAQLEQHRLADPAAQRQESALGQVCHHDRHRERDRNLDHHGAVAVPYQRADAVIDAEHDQIRTGHLGPGLQQQQDEEPNERLAMRPQE